MELYKRLNIMQQINLKNNVKINNMLYIYLNRIYK